MQPKVSIIIPVYNIKKYLRECLDSVCNQTLKEIQVIAVDDGSTDGSADICREFEKKYPTIFSYYYKENGGAASARNLGIEHAVGEYIGFVDSDDWVEPDMYEKMYCVAENNNVDIVFCRTFENECPGAYEYIFPRKGYYSREDMKTELFPCIFPSITSKGNFRNIRWCNWLRIYRKSVIDENNIRFLEKSRRCEDLGFSAACTIYSNNYYYFDERLYHNRPNALSKSRNYSKEMWKSISELMKYLKQVSSGCSDYDFSHAMDVCIFYFCTMVIRNELRSPSKKQSEENVLEVINDPLCSVAVEAVSCNGMNKEYTEIYSYMKNHDHRGLIRYLKRLTWKKKHIMPIMNSIFKSAVISKLYGKLRRR